MRILQQAAPAQENEDDVPDGTDRKDDDGNEKRAQKIDDRFENHRKRLRTRGP